MTCIGQRHVPPLPAKKLRTQSRLELLDAGGDVGGHPIELGCRTQHAALTGYTAEDVQIFEVDYSHYVNVCFVKFTFRF